MRFGHRGKTPGLVLDLFIIVLNRVTFKLFCSLSCGVLVLADKGKSYKQGFLMDLLQMRK